MEEQHSMNVLLKDYPSLLSGVNRLGIRDATDFQLQLWQVSVQMQHIIISAPAQSGKVVGLLLHTLRQFSNQQQGLLVVLSHSKDLSHWLHTFLTLCLSCPVINLYMQDIGEIISKTVLIGSPLQVNNLWKKEKDKITIIAIPEVDLLYGFGYGDALELLAGSINPSKVVYKLSCVQRGSEIEKFRTEWMKKAHKINYKAPDSEMKQQQKQQQITHFYGVGDRMSVPISLYLTLKFSLVSPKILILVQNLRQVYRYGLFLQRCRIGNVGIYNHEDPINLRFYVLSVWMGGSTSVMIATPQLLQQLNSDIFRKMCRKKYKRDRFVLVNMSAIIIIGMNYLSDQFDKIINHFQVKPFIMTFIENKEDQIKKLQMLISYQRNNFEHTVIKELPISRKEIQGFRYRVQDVWGGLTNHRADLYRQLDFKKKLLKTPELKEEFQSNVKEREVLVKAINDLRNKIDHRKVQLSEYIPDYLVPQCLKASYNETLKSQKVDQQSRPMSHQKVQKVLRYVDLEDENPQTTDVSRLKLISARKRWKLLHGFKLKKRNKRLQKKGVFDS